MSRLQTVFPAGASLLASAVLSASAPSALADPALPPPADTSIPKGRIVLDLGLAAGVRPRYPGADDYGLRAVPLLGIERLTLPVVGVVAEGPAKGVFVYPAYRLDGERKASDRRDLAGTKDVDWALGLGLGAGVNRGDWRAFVEVLAGVKGYSGLTARAGADYLWSPSPKTVMAIGPRFDLAGQDYTRTWFGVTPAEAAASGGALPAFAPDGGLASAGLAVNWGRAINDQTMVTVGAGWDRRLGESADSPLVRRGGRDAAFLTTGLTWRLGFGGS